MNKDYFKGQINIFNRLWNAADINRTMTTAEDAIEIATLLIRELNKIHKELTENQKV